MKTYWWLFVPLFIFWRVWVVAHQPPEYDELGDPIQADLAAATDKA